EGMSCNHCKMTVENAVGALSGVERAEVDLKAKTLTVSYDESTVDMGRIRNAVEGKGYQVV
ncbi:MAG TPA: copper ion binding protein, partial [Acidobacteriota bacterium]|nr:copper ion binding protein [Acidobacteriota bacterium]